MDQDQELYYQTGAAALETENARLREDVDRLRRWAALWRQFSKHYRTWHKIMHASARRASSRHLKDHAELTALRQENAALRTYSAALQDENALFRSEVAALRRLLGEAQAEAYRKDKPWLNQV